MTIHNQYYDDLLARYPELKTCQNEIMDAYCIFEECFRNRGKLLIAGNGGSAADAEHIAGELMKSFRKPRSISRELAETLTAVDNSRGKYLSNNLECGLKAIPLTSHVSLSTAILNDVGNEVLFAQQLLGFADGGDVFLAISTSGNSENILNAAIVAKALGVKVVGLTGASGGELANIADITVKVPQTETFKIQELHLPIYHSWCLMLEDYFF